MPSGEESAVRSKPSLRAELLFNLAFLAAGALLLAVATALIAPLLSSTTLGAILVVALVAADIAIFILFGRYLVSRLVTEPIDALVAATDAVAGGRLEQRAPDAATRELDTLARSVNRMTERLLDAQGALIRAEKLASVGRLAAGVAHEVGNPLAAATNYAEVLRRRGADAEALAGLSRELERIDAIVKSMLEYARPRGAAVREPLDLAQLARGAMDLLAAQGVLRGVTTSAPELGPAPVSGDRTGLEQVCVNLLLNAVDAAGEGGRITVMTGRANAATPAGRVQLIVADSGPGVRPEDAGRIFDPFVTTKEPGKGTGLGLAIVQRIVEDHGGRIDIRPAAEGGAAFVVTLPERS